MTSVKVALLVNETIESCNDKLDYSSETSSTRLKSTWTADIFTVISNKLCLSYVIYQK